MKKILTIFFLIMSVTLSAQVDTIGYTPGMENKALRQRLNSTINLVKTNTAAIILKLNKADTLTGAGHYATDRRADLIESSVLLKLSKSDTLNMLLHYIERKDTTFMLTKYLRKSNATIPNIIKLQDSLNNKYTKAQSRQNVNDSLNKLRINADLLIDIGFIHADTLDLIATHNYVATHAGGGTGGGGSATSSLFFRVGTTSGAPLAGDSVIQNVTGLAAKHVEVHRGTTATNMSLMARNISGGKVSAEPYTFHYVPSTGKITVRPVFATNDRFEVWATDSTTWTDLAFSGTGGNNILDANLLAFWKFDETIGTRLDATATNADLTPFGTLNYSATAKFGNSVSGSGDKRSGMSVTGLGIAPTGNNYTIAFWIYIDSLPSTVPVVGTIHDNYIFYGNNTGTNDLTCYIPATGSTPDRIRFKYYDNGVLMDFGHPTTLLARTWYCVSASVRSMDYSVVLLQKLGDASPTAGYDNAAMATGLDAPNSSFTIMNSSATGTAGVDGYLDIMGVWNRAWNTVDFAEFFKAGAGHNYPF